MSDAMNLVLLAGFVLFSWGLVVLCDRLGGER
jgi:hypothetical protein